MVPQKSIRLTTWVASSRLSFLYRCMHGSVFRVTEQTALQCRFVFASYSKSKKFKKKKCPLFRTLTLKGLTFHNSIWYVFINVIICKRKDSHYYNQRCSDDFVASSLSLETDRQLKRKSYTTYTSRKAAKKNEKKLKFR